MKISLGNLVGIGSMIIAAMNTVQDLFKKGSEKRPAAITLTQQLVELVEGAAGKDYVTDAKVVEAIGAFIDAAKTLENVIADVKAHKASPAIPAA